MAKSSSLSADLALLEPFWREAIERVVLPNGVTLLLKTDSASAIASVQVWVKTGSIHEGAKLGGGLSHYLEHMLFKGTERRAGREISATVQAHGGYINAYTTFDRTVYYIDIPANHATVAVDVLADAVLHSTLPADEVEKEKQVILREIAMGQDDPDTRFYESFFDTAYRVHPYRLPVIGHRDVFAALTREDLVAYYRARYVPDNLVVVVTGGVDPVALRAAVTEHFGSAPRRELAPVYLPDEPPPQAPRSLHRYEDIELTRAGLAWPIPGLAHPDAPALDLLAMILGHGDSSLLWQSVREKARLVHSIDAASWNPGTTGLFYVSFTCDGVRREAAAAAVHRELARVTRSGFTATQIRKAVRQLVVGEINTRKTVAGQASRLGVAEVVVGDLHHTRGYFDRLRQVTPAVLKRVLSAYLRPERLTSVSLNPTASAPAAAGAATAQAAAGTAFEEVRLPNGARILLRPDRRLPNLHLRVLFHGGASFEDPARRGATSLLVTVMTKDTKRLSSAAVAQRIEEVGGAFHPFAGTNSFGVAAEVLPPDLDRALGALFGALFEPAFRATTVATERDALLAELAQDSDDVVTFGRKLLRKKFFGSHPLSVEPSGTEEGVRAITAADLKALHTRLVIAPNAVLVATGDFVIRDLLPRLKTLLGRLPRGAFELPVRRHTGAAEPGEFVEHQPRQQAVVYQAFPGPGLLDPDFDVAEVADELFSGMSSRLFERVREEKGLAYFVRSGRVVGLHTGMFYFQAGTAPGRDGEVLAEIDAEVARMAAGGIEAGELLRCQTRLKAARRMSLQTNASRAMQAGLNALYGQPLEDLAGYDARVDAITISALARFAQARLRRELRTQLVVKP
jgi:zinc protease